MLWLESSGVPGLPKRFSYCSLVMPISSLGHSHYELCNLIQYTVGGSNKTSNFLNSNTICKKRGKKRFHTALSVISTFQTALKIMQIYKRSCQPTHFTLEAYNLDMFPTKTSGKVHGIRGCSPPNLLRLRFARSWDVHDNISVCPPA